MVLQEQQQPISLLLKGLKQNDHRHRFADGEQHGFAALI